MAAKSKPAKAKLTVGKCEIYASFEMTCPLCKVLVPANTQHVCRKEA